MASCSFRRHLQTLQLDSLYFVLQTREAMRTFEKVGIKLDASTSMAWFELGLVLRGTGQCKVAVSLSAAAAQARVSCNAMHD